MKPIWAIQKFAVNDSDGQGMKEAIESLGMNLEVLAIPPFDYGHIEPIKYDGHVIPYGGTKFIDSIKDKEGWFCVFNDDFTYKKAIEMLGDRMFNADGTFMKMKDFNPSMYKGEEFLFIRPDKDTKEFAGEVVEPSEFMKWRNAIELKGWGVNEETDILVATPSRIDEEWRIFIVDGKVIDGSRYRMNHTLSIDPVVPSNVIEYVEESIAIWSPAAFFVMDICRVGDGLNILEIGDLHSAGWYATDKKKVIEAVSNYVEGI